MRTLLNIIWLILSGFWLFLGYALAALVMFILIVTIPWGIAAWRIGVYSLWPFGKTVVEKPSAGAWSVLGNIVWVILAGWWLAIAHITSALALAITIIGIPFAWANLKMVPVALLPLGKEIVDKP
ncbi:MAG: YccF domain-containing protein [Microbacterium sp.]|jgi:uncharacterized membrane protein YccF (DUF307 family)|nr:YccF domain-containing protein [Microbacterium sp.]MBA4346645.1 YccF domain-containing protein [Microbacterium sp.]